MASEGHVEYLDTADFTPAIEAFKTQTKEYDRIKNDVQTATNRLLWHWYGEGRNQFEDEYDVIFQKIQDIGDILTGLYTTLVDAQATYYDVDNQLSIKLLEK